MCTCNAYTYASCPKGHCKFESVSTCLSARLGLRDKCQEVIVNGKEGKLRAWPVIDGTCPECFPEKAAEEQKQKKEAAAQKKKDEAAQKKRGGQLPETGNVDSFTNIMLE
ncbi:hypothetical protein F5Y18DRAFT_422799 [Xylariaceae sp. FL1019]|nr:hypothetical protein F5Y18DRAFT_422799 [Xylariaceae sp. FL1019]